MLGPEFRPARTLNHMRKRFTEDAPLPRFTLSSESDAEEMADKTEAAETSKRPSLTPRAARHVMRVRPKIDSTEEIEVQDILLEAYVEEPAPRAAVPPPAVTKREAGLSRAKAEDVDALLASVRVPTANPFMVPGVARAPFATPTPSPWSELPPASQEVPSVAPVVVSGSTLWPSAGLAHVTPPSGAVSVPAPAPVVPARRRSALATFAWSALLLVVGVAIGAALMLRLPPGTATRALEAARTRLHPTTPVAAAPPAPPVVTLPSAAAPVTAPSAVPAPTSSVVTMPASALPAPAIPAGKGRVTLPAYARGHRVFVDGVALPTTEGDVLLRCGRRSLRIGSGGKGREIDVPCGGQLVVP